MGVATGGVVGGVTGAETGGVIGGVVGGVSGGIGAATVHCPLSSYDHPAFILYDRNALVKKLSLRDKTYENVSRE